jgi:acyl-CoA thioesterase-1
MPQGCPFARRAAAAALVVLLAAVLGCHRDHTASPAPAPAAAPGTAAARQPYPPQGNGRPRIVALGDSLTAGLGLLESQAYPALLEAKLAEDGYAFDVINAGISGDTTAAGLARTDWVLQGDVRVLIVELGANDGLRGLPVAEMKKNLGAIIDKAQTRGIWVLLLGMEAPPNFGPEYASSFRQVYRDLANERHVALVPFMLDKVAGHPDLNQADGIHPTAEGTRIVAETIWHALRPVVDAVLAS